MRSLASLKVVEDDLRRKRKLQRPVATSINLLFRLETTYATSRISSGLGTRGGCVLQINSKYRWKCVFVCMGVCTWVPEPDER